MVSFCRQVLSGNQRCLWDEPLFLFKEFTSDFPFCAQNNNLDLLFKFGAKIKIFAIEFRIDSVF